MDLEQLKSASIEEVVDELWRVKDESKKLKAIEDACKKRIEEDGRNEIQGKDHLMNVSIRSKEVFNEDAFIEQLKNDPNFDDTIKAKAIDTKLIINEANLSELVQNGEIPIDYVKPFNTITESKVISVK